MTDFVTSVSRRYYVGIASVLLAVALMVGSAHAGGWDEFVKRCIAPMEAGDGPAVVGLEPVDKDPVGQAFDLPGSAHITVRPAFGTLGIQCQVVTQPVGHSKGEFDAWIMGAEANGNYTADAEIESRWVTGDSYPKPLAMDVWQEGDWMVFQLSFLAVKS